MRSNRLEILAACVVAGALGLMTMPAAAQALPLEPPFKTTGQGVTGAFEGWFPNPDGTFSLLFGYYNRNQTPVDIPIGENNRIEPGGPDQGQPTHFLPGRQWGLFTVQVPAGFGDQRVTWSLTVNGQSTQIPGYLQDLWLVSSFKDANGNTPPTIRFEGGTSGQGPRAAETELSAAAGAPLTISLWASDDAHAAPGETVRRGPAASLTWSKFRGPGEVTFEPERPPVDTNDPDTQVTGAKFSGKATTTATFSQPGEYRLYVVANDATGKGGRGFQCCWTNGHVTVSVGPSK